MTINRIGEKFDDFRKEVENLNDFLRTYEYLCANNIQMPMEESNRLMTGIMESWDEIKKIVNED